MVSSPLFLSLKNREASSRKGESIKLKETRDGGAFGYFIFHRLSLSTRSHDLISISLDGGERERHGSILGEITAIAVKTRTFVPPLSLNPSSLAFVSFIC